MTQGQFQQLLAAVTAGMAAPTAGAGAAAVMGRMGPCDLGREKLKQFKKFKDWHREASAKMSLLGLTTDQQKINFLRSCAGQELTEFWEKQAKITWEAAGDQVAYTYEEVIKATNTTLLSYVSRDRAIIDLLHMPQGDDSVTEFVTKVEDQAALCRVVEKPITEDDLKRLALIAGFKDRQLAEKCLGEQYDIKQVITTAITRESSKANAEAVKVQDTTSVKQVNTEAGFEERLHKLVKEGCEETVRKMQKKGRFSGTAKKTCPKCTFDHERDSNCPAEGKECRRCGLEGHFARSSICKGRQTQSNKRVEQVNKPTEEEVEEANYLSDDEVIHRVVEQKVPETIWPGVRRGGNTYSLRRIGAQGDKWVKVKVGNSEMELFADTGCKFTLITPQQYRPSMGKVVASDTHLRGWGSETYLDVKGMFRTTISMAKGAETKTWVYIVDGYRAEALLGDRDAEKLGVITFHKEGRKMEEVNLLVADLRKSGVKVNTGKEAGVKPTQRDHDLTMSVVDKFLGTSISDRIGKVKVKPVRLEYEPRFRAIQPQRYAVPYHYQDRLSQHLQKLREEGVLEDVDPREPIDCILNIALSEKKNGDIRMNIDARPLNKGAKMTRYHITTPQEVRHNIKDARYFSELDMGHGFHQVPLDQESSRSSVFQSHEGLHRMKRLYFGPMSASGIFHHVVSQQLAGLRGCISIHDNVLVYGSTLEEHNHNLEEMLQRAAERGITFKLSKSTFCQSEVRWFGRIFSATGMSPTSSPQAGRSP